MNPLTQSLTATVAEAVKTLAEHMIDSAQLLRVLEEQATNAWELVDGSLVVEPDMWHADDGNAEIAEKHDSGEDAAQSYVDGGDWGDTDETRWIKVATWREGIDEDGDIVRVDEQSHKITIEPDEPDCADGQGHDWQSPYSILGGLKENPGVWGSGGGVRIEEVCMRCGCSKTTDTWAQDRSDGEQGLTSTYYVPDKYADEIEALHAEEEEEA
jgi:hypothetical protein